jgi:putative sigma-54 modulation protein
MDHNEIIISGVHFDLSERVKHTVREKAAKLFNHESHIVRLRVELEYNQNKKHGKEQEYIAKGHIEIRGNDLIVSAETDSIYKSIDQMIDKLDRKLRRRHRLGKVKRKQARAVEIDATLPKVDVA